MGCYTKAVSGEIGKSGRVVSKKLRRSLRFYWKRRISFAFNYPKIIGGLAKRFK